MRVGLKMGFGMRAPYSDYSSGFRRPLTNSGLRKREHLEFREIVPKKFESQSSKEKPKHVQSTSLNHLKRVKQHPAETSNKISFQKQIVQKIKSESLSRKQYFPSQRSSEQVFISESKKIDPEQRVSNQFRSPSHNTSQDPGNQTQSPDQNQDSTPVLVSEPGTGSITRTLNAEQNQNILEAQDSSVQKHISQPHEIQFSKQSEILLSFDSKRERNDSQKIATRSPLPQIQVDSQGSGQNFGNSKTNSGIVF